MKLISKIFFGIKLFISNGVSVVMISLFSRMENITGGSRNLLCINTEKLGDIAMASDFLYSIGRSGVYDRIFLIVPEIYKELCDWKGAGIVVIPLEKNKYKYNLYYRIKLLKQVKELKIKTSINFTPERGWINDELTLTANAVDKIAFKNKSKYLTSFALNNSNEKYTKFYVNRNGSEYNNLMSYLSELSIPVLSSKNFINPIAPANHIGFKRIGSKYICIAPCSSEMERSWGLEKYSLLCEELSKEYKIIVLGSEGERKIISRYFDDSNNVLNTAGKFTLNETAAVIKNAELFIGNDSGLSHIALNLGVPLICMTGGGKYGKFFPYKEREDAVFLYDYLDCFACDWECIYDKRYCLTNVAVETVLQNAIRLLEN